MRNGIRAVHPQLSEGMMSLVEQKNRRPTIKNDKKVYRPTIDIHQYSYFSGRASKKAVTSMRINRDNSSRLSQRLKVPYHPRIRWNTYINITERMQTWRSCQKRNKRAFRSIVFCIKSWQL